MKIEIPNFEIFVESNISGRFIVNPFWLEHLLNLHFQDYWIEVWEEIQDTILNQKISLMNLGLWAIVKEEVKPKQRVRELK